MPFIVHFSNLLFTFLKSNCNFSVVAGMLVTRHSCSIFDNKYKISVYAYL